MKAVFRQVTRDREIAQGSCDDQERWWEFERPIMHPGLQSGVETFINEQSHIYGCVRDKECIHQTRVLCDCPCHNDEPGLIDENNNLVDVSKDHFYDEKGNHIAIRREPRGDNRVWVGRYLNGYLESDEVIDA